MLKRRRTNNAPRAGLLGDTPRAGLLGDAPSLSPLNMTSPAERKTEPAETELRGFPGVDWSPSTSTTLLKVAPPSDTEATDMMFNPQLITMERVTITLPPYIVVQDERWQTDPRVLKRRANAWDPRIQKRLASARALVLQPIIIVDPYEQTPQYTAHRRMCGLGPT